MEVILPKKSENSIDLYAINFYEGIVFTSNPRGIIYKDPDAGGYGFMNRSSLDSGFWTEELSDLIDTLLKKYPKISLEYLPAEK